MVTERILLIDELSDKKNQKQLRKVVSKIIKDSGILKDSSHWKKSIEFIPYAPNTERCTIFFKISADNTIANEEITILIRPDNDIKHRVIRVVIQEGDKVLQKREDCDGGFFFHKSDTSVYRKEISAIEHDIKNMLANYVSEKKHA
ncbi:MAG: hypothetical protein ACOCUR_01115 [Nanoarchaeota archaeon]